ncbi:MAG: protein-glutamate O-methyltransferase CheR [Clostridia bacterium]|nr:protein-glutamate O-methyltransferase CheR [Clostridia bacterium]
MDINGSFVKIDTTSPFSIQLKDEEFRLLATFIKAHYGIHLKDEKKALVNGRLQGVLQSLNMKSFKEYYDYMVADKSGDAVLTLVNKITTNHTYFMRESDHFSFLKSHVLPQLDKTIRDKDVRIWCAACSSGEEAYTLAMLVNDHFPMDWDKRILATDISTKVLNQAIEGIYGNDRLEDLPKTWLNTYFRRLDSERSVASDSLKDQVIFRRFNLMEENFPFKKRFHVIFCRNVMIYFDQETKTKLIHKLYDCLEWGGYLFVGHSESITREETRFKTMMPAVYQKV